MGGASIDLWACTDENGGGEGRDDEIYLLSEPTPPTFSDKIRVLAMAGASGDFIACTVEMLYKSWVNLKEFMCSISPWFLVIDADVIHELDGLGRNALMYAVHFGHLDTIQILLEQGVDINYAAHGK